LGKQKRFLLELRVHWKPFTFTNLLIIRNWNGQLVYQKLVKSKQILLLICRCSTETTSYSFSNGTAMANSYWQVFNGYWGWEVKRWNGFWWDLI